MFLKQSTAYTFRMGPFLDETDGKTAETGLTISQADVRLSKAGGNFAQKNESTSASHDEIGYYIVILDATDTATVGELLVAVHESGALPVFKTFQVVEEAIYDAIYGASADLVTKVDAIDTVVDSILVDTGTTLDGKIDTIDGIVDAILVDTGTTLPATLDTIDNFLDTEVAAILADTNELQGDWVDGGRLDLLLDSVISKLDVVDGIVDDILVDTGTTLDGKIDTIDNFLDTEVAAILADTNELQGDWANGGRLDLLLDSAISKIDVVDGVVDSILVDTAEIGSAGAGLTAVPWNSAWDAEVQSECADALTAYDAPTKAELDSAFTEIKGASWASGTDTLEAIRDRGDAAWTTGSGGAAPTAAAIADAVWDEATSGHTTSGTFGEQVKTDIDAILVDTGTTLDGKIDVIDGIVDSILVDTGTTLNDKIDVIDGIVDSILVDTGTTLDGKLDTIDNFLDTEVAAILADTNELQTDWANGGRLDALLDSAIAKIDVVDGVVDSILVDTGTTIPATIATIDTVVDAILVDTAVIGAAGAGLTAVPWNAAWDAEVQSECADALAAIGLDHIVSASVAGSDVADDSIVAKLVSKESTADWDDFVNTTDSLQALRDRGDSAWTTGGGGSGPTASEIADAVWDEAASGHNTGGTFGKYVRQLKDGTISVESAVNDASATTTSFVTDLTEATDDHYIGKTLAFTSGNLSSQSRIISDYNGTTKAITFDEALTEAPADGDEFIILSTHAHTVTEIKEAVRTEMDSNSTKLAAIVADTAEIGTAGAGLTAVPWNSSWDAEVQSEVTDALNAYDPPTKAEMDAMWTTAQTESYAPDGATATPAQLLYMILCAVSEFSISSTTITGKKVDGSTTAMTWTLDDATSPTSRTRAS